MNCLSVRTGFDMVLRSLQLTPGTEILVTGVNIPDMFNIIVSHQLVPVALPVKNATLCADLSDVQKAITPLTRVILITHLFGAIADIDGIVATARHHNLIIIEDCAQAFNGTYTGHHHTDVVMFSFGLIKTHTALTGASLLINNATIRQHVSDLHKTYPKQLNGIFTRKAFKSFFIKLLTQKSLYTLFYKFCRLSGKDFDVILSGFTRGFPGNALFEKIRYRPNAANLKLLRSRLSNVDLAVLEKRMQIADITLANLPTEMLVGYACTNHSHWVLPVKTDKPNALIKFLRTNGFDATQKASSLIQLNQPDDSNTTDLDLNRLVYLPIHPAMCEPDCHKLAALLKRFYYI